MEFLNSVQLDQLVTAAGFIAYLIYQNWRKDQRIDKLEDHKSELTQKYIDAINQSNRDITDAIRVLDKVMATGG